VDTYPKLNYISLYSGGGGLDLAFKLANPGARAICYVEREASAIAVLADHMQTGQLDDAPIFADSGTFDGKPWRGKVDFVIGGFPCQPASVAGRRSGQDDERWLFPHIRRIVRETHPQGVFLENVRGLLSVNDGDGFEEILRDLASLGYDVEWGVLKASDVGASHRRERVFIYAQMADPRHDGQELQTSELPKGYELQPRNGTREALGIPRSGSEQLETGIQQGHELADSRYDARGTESEQQREEPSEVSFEDGTAGYGVQSSFFTQKTRIMGNSDSTRLQGYRRQYRLREDSQEKEVVGTSSSLANPNDSGDSSLQYGVDGKRAEEDKRREGQSQSESTGYDGELVNSDGERRRSESYSELSSEGIDFGRRPLPWPPRPTSPEWGQILSERPDLAPAQSKVRGMDDGLAGGLARADKLRILGNGVVPQQAATAFLLLKDRMNNGHIN
jgi:DNA (cytosine-5)-methyltransferase 1|tara:strand:- start:520 stop:1863 length:1344 start_codon:yes stop_codon:yes gene_type:complete